MATATRTKRTQIKAAPVFKSVDEVSDALRDLCDISSRVSAREAKLQEAITQLRAEADEDLADDLSQQARLEKDIEEYCTTYRDEVFPPNRKSLELAHGKIDFREHPPAVVVSKSKRMTIAAVLDNIKERFGRKADTYIRTKEDLNKDALITLEEPELNNLGLEIQRKETFGISLKLETVAPASTTTARA